MKINATLDDLNLKDHIIRAILLLSPQHIHYHTCYSHLRQKPNYHYLPNKVSILNALFKPIKDTDTSDLVATPNELGLRPELQARP